MEYLVYMFEHVNILVYDDSKWKHDVFKPFYCLLLATGGSNNLYK